MSETSSARPRMHRPVLVLAAGVALGLVGGWFAGRGGVDGAASATTTDDSRVLARVGGETLTVAQFESRWEALGQSGRAFYDRRGGAKTFLDELVDELALVIEARERGIDRRPEVAEAMRAASNRALTRPLLAEEVRDAAVPESELRAWYDAHQGELAIPTQVELSEIVVTSASNSGPSDDTPDALSARAKAERLRGLAAAGGDFADLARRHSEAPTALQGGLLGWVGAGALPPAYEAAAMALGEGETSRVIEIPEGVAILHATGRREARNATFEERREAIQARLLADDEEALSRRYRAFVGGIRQRVGVSLDETALPAELRAVPPTADP